MAKTNDDLTVQGHTDGDEDGLGCSRGMFAMFGIEVLAAIAFGLVLHFAVWK